MWKKLVNLYYYYIIFFMLNSFFFLISKDIRVFLCVFLLVVVEIHHELSLLRFLCVSDIHECVIKTRKSTSFLLSNLFERERTLLLLHTANLLWWIGKKVIIYMRVPTWYGTIGKYMLMKKANKELWFYGYRSFREWSSIISYVDAKCFVVRTPNEHMYQIWPI